MASLRRQGYVECSAFADLAFHMDLPAVEVHDVLRDGKPQARPLLLGKRPRESPLEGSEQSIHLGMANARAVILYGYKDVVRTMRDSNLNSGPRLAVLDRVLDQVIENLADLYLI